MILSDLQNKAAKEIKKWYINYNYNKKPYYTLAGIAGSGKSSIAYYIIKELGIENVVMATYTGMAACVLIRKGNENVSTIHRLIYNTKIIEDKETKKKKFVTELKDKEELSDVDLIIIDEYSMVPNNIIEDLLTFKKPILFLGDPLQLPAIFGETSLKYDFFLNEPHRQALDNPILILANYARLNKLDKIRIGSYGDNVNVYSKLNFDMESLLNSDQIICGKNNTVNSLNKFYRYEFLKYKTWKLETNEKLMCILNNWESDNGDGYSLVNGLIGTANNIVSKPKMKLYEFDFKPEFTNKFTNVVADRLILEGKEIDSFTELMRLPLSDSINKLNEFVFAYAITTHKSQGSEWDYVSFFPEVLNKNTHYRFLYTGITRASKKLDLIL